MNIIKTNNFIFFDIVTTGNSPLINITIKSEEKMFIIFIPEKRTKKKMSLFMTEINGLIFKTIIFKLCIN